MAYLDVALVQATDPGDILTAAWCDQVRDNEEYLIDPAACSIFNSAAVSVNDSTATTLNANSELYDNDSMHSLSLNTSRITIQTAGRYLLTSTVEFATNATGFRQIQFLLNSVAIASSVSRLPGFAGAAAYVQSTITQVLAVGDFLEAQVFHTAGGPLNVTFREFAALFLTR